MNKTVEQLRDKLKAIIGEARTSFLYTDDCKEITNEHFADQILSVFLDQTKEDCPECGGRGYFVVTVGNNDESGGCHEEEDICKNCQGTRKVGEWHPERLCVKAKEQILPEVNINVHIWNDYHPDWAYEKAIQDMLREGWVKVEKEAR